MTDPLISVVIPVYNVEKYLSGCLDSILNQTYKNLEIICVNDASPDSSIDILKDYSSRDSRIKIVNYEKNRGLFHARLAGADIATGDYICFVDSDDTISLDWLRLLLKKSLEEKADMVLANTVQLRDSRYFIENNYMSLCFDRAPLEGKEIFSTLLKNAGLCFAWHTVWNKLYSMDLWKKARPAYDDMQGHLIMAEDIAYSVVLYYYAQRMAFSNHEGYFYFRNEQASTNAFISLDRIKKHISDVSKVFNFCESFMKKQGIYEEYADYFQEFKDRNFRIQSNILYARGLWNDHKYRNLLCKSFGKKEPELSHPNDFWFYEIKTNWESNSFFSENLLKRISDPAVDIVSFDLFDTLILRPFNEPQKMFDFFARKYSDYLEKHNIINYANKRKEAEQFCRTQLSLTNDGIEDCTLSEIFQIFADRFHIDQDVANELKQFEEDTEYELCTLRKNGLSLIEFAKHCNKKIIYTSDIYYEENFIEKLLTKLNIPKEKLFLSSKTRRLKATGELYKYIKNTFPDKTILHIGDNWASDIISAQQQGLKTTFIPSTKEIFENRHYDNYTSDALVTKMPCLLTFSDIKEFNKDLPLNACIAISQNRMFDKPYPSWNPELRYNANYYFIGNYVFGTEMLGLASYIYKIVREHNYKKIVFLARDGYLPKIAFDTFLSNRNISDIKTDYFHVSRRSLIPIALERTKNLNCIQSCIAIERHSANSIVELLSDYLHDTDTINKDLEDALIIPDKKFENQHMFEKTMRVLNKHIDFTALSCENQKLRNALKEIFDEETIAFDLGYSGRIQTLLSQAVGTPIDVIFLHSCGSDAEIMAKKAGFKIYSYLSYTPKITSIVREYFFSEAAASCIGYRIDGNHIIPIFDKSKYDYTEKFIQQEIIRGMNAFISDYCTTFSPYDFMFEFRSEEISLPFEAFMNQIPQKDMWTFHCCHAEDILYYNYSQKSLYDIWNYNIQNLCGMEYHSLAEKAADYEIANTAYKISSTQQYQNLPKWKKAMVLFFADKKLFWEKIKAAFSKRRNKK